MWEIQGMREFSGMYDIWTNCTINILHSILQIKKGLSLLILLCLRYILRNNESPSNATFQLHRDEVKKKVAI